MPMTEEEKSKCKKIIHGHAVAAAAGNLVPVPGVGLATDTVTMTTMAMALASVFGGSITESVAKNMAINAIVATIKKQPVKVIAKEISKVVPIIGQLVADDLSAERDKAQYNAELGALQSGHNFKYEKKFQLPNPE